MSICVYMCVCMCVGREGEKGNSVGFVPVPHLREVADKVDRLSQKEKDQLAGYKCDGRSGKWSSGWSGRV